MATDTVVPHHTSPIDELDDNKVNEEEKPLEQDTVSPSKRSEENENPKAEVSSSVGTPLSKPEVGVEKKKIEPPVVEVLKTDDAPVVDVPYEVKSVENEEKEQPVADYLNIQPKEQSTPESIAKQLEEGLVGESVEKMQPELLKIIDVPKSSHGTIEKPEELAEVLPVRESEVVEKAVSMKTEKSELLVPEVGVKPEGHSKISENFGMLPEVETKCEEVQQNEIKEGGTAKKEDPLVDEIGDGTLVKEEEESSAITISEQVVSTNQQAQADQEEIGGETSVPDASSDDGNKELSVADVVEKLPKETVSEMRMAGEQNELTEELTLPKKVDDRNTSIPSVEVVEMPIELENFGKVDGPVETKIEETVKDEKPVEIPAKPTQKQSEAIGLVATETEGSVIDEKPAFVDTNKDVYIEGNVIEGIATVNEQVTASQQSELELKDEESGKEIVNETAKSEVQNMEPPTKVGHDDTKTTEILPKTTGLVETNTEEIVKYEKPAFVETNEDLYIEQKIIEGNSAGDEPVTESQQSEIKLKDEESEKEIVDETAKSEVQNLEPPTKDGHDDTKTSEILLKSIGLVETTTEDSVKDEKPAFVETSKDVYIEQKVIEGTSTGNEPVTESQQSEIELKDEESEKEIVDETAKSEFQNLEPATKDGHDDTKTSVILPKTIGLVETNTGESVKDEKPAFVDTNKDVYIEGKVIEGTATCNEPVAESQQSELEPKDEESEKAIVDEIAKSEAQNLESHTNDGHDDTKTSEILPKTIGLVETNTEDNVKDEKPAFVEPNKDVYIEGKVIEDTTTGNEPVTEFQQSEIGLKDEESEKEIVDETAKSEVQNLEPPTKDSDETKASEILPKEILTKPTQKQSKTFILKVKQSLLKAKKAIIGKSPSQTKGE
ncbi:hypothetical protein CFOL_v3_16953 [Cephalotus follicularis]|uniref:Uncharacterized protein n=1 Tax=Cephalotus follicularis TaxID=3775 RepID=A0A1Q3C029_CEPFO|nr:hypothetical protein CFOL_v3_16953 [Cephalotus follicularis]